MEVNRLLNFLELKRQGIQRIFPVHFKIMGTEFSSMEQYMMFQKAKFSQNIDLKEKLIKTGNAILAECAVKDRIWGIGLSMKDEKRFECREWRGQNLLGYALMMVREKLSQ